MRKNLNFSGTLTFMTVIAISISLVPFSVIISLFTQFSTQANDRQVLLFTAVNIFLSVLGFIFSMIENKFIPQNKRTIMICSRAVVLSLMLAALVFIFGRRYPFYIPLGAAAFVLGYLNYFLLPGFSSFKVMTTIYLAEIFIFFLLKVQYPVSYLMVSYFIYSAVLLFVQNQENITSLMTRRHHKLEHLPKKIRAFNVISISLVILIMLIVLLLRNYVVGGVKLILELLRQVVIFIIWLISNMSSSSTEAAEPAPERSQEMGGLKTTSDGNPILDFLAIVVAIIVAVKLLYSARWWIVNAFKKIFLFISRIVSKFLEDSSLGKYFAENTDEYYDKVETLEYTGMNYGLKNGGRKYTAKKWNREYSKFLSIKSADEKIKAGYSLMIRWLSLKGAEILSLIHI